MNIGMEIKNIYEALLKDNPIVLFVGVVFIVVLLMVFVFLLFGKMWDIIKKKK